MSKRADPMMRGVLWFGAVFNCCAAVMVAFPDTIGAFSGLPATGPLFYRWLLVLFIALFGGAYAWMALQEQISRPLVALAALGKAGVFVVSMICWHIGDIPAQSIPPAIIDLAFGIVFAWWLVASRSKAEST